MLLLQQGWLIDGELLKQQSVVCLLFYAIACCNYYFTLFLVIQFCIPLSAYIQLFDGVMFYYQEVLIAEDDKMKISAIEDSRNLIEIKNGSFGWPAQPESDSLLSSGIEATSHFSL